MQSDLRRLVRKCCLVNRELRGPDKAHQLPLALVQVGALLWLLSLFSAQAYQQNLLQLSQRCCACLGFANLGSCWHVWLNVHTLVAGRSGAAGRWR